MLILQHLLFSCGSHAVGYMYHNLDFYLPWTVFYTVAACHELFLFTSLKTMALLLRIVEVKT